MAAAPGGICFEGVVAGEEGDGEGVVGDAGSRGGETAVSFAQRAVVLAPVKGFALLHFVPAASR